MLLLVPTVRFELTRLAPPPPQDGVSANSTTSAQKSVNREWSMLNRFLKPESALDSPSTIYRLPLLRHFLRFRCRVCRRARLGSLQRRWYRPVPQRLAWAGLSRSNMRWICHCCAIERMLLTSQYSTSPAGKKKKNKPHERESRQLELSRYGNFCSHPVLTITVKCADILLHAGLKPAHGSRFIRTESGSGASAFKASPSRDTVNCSTNLSRTHDRSRGMPLYNPRMDMCSDEQEWGNAD